MLLDIALFILGFFILIKGSDILIRGASSIARLYHISAWVIGVIIVGIGTSIPEFSITLASVFKDAEIGIGTIIGSTTFNILGILGLVAILTPLTMKKATVFREFVLSAVIILATAVFSFQSLAGRYAFIGITQREAFILLVFFLAWLGYELKRGKKEATLGAPAKVYTVFVPVLMIFLGIVGVVLGGKWVVDGAVTLARAFGASEALIGLTIIGMGTSLPEFAVSLTAALKRENELAIGNIVGSNIFNYLGIFSIVSLVKPLPFAQIFTVDYAVAFSATLLLIVYMYTGKKFVLQRWQGVVFLALYLFYIMFLVIRG